MSGYNNGLSDQVASTFAPPPEADIRAPTMGAVLLGVLGHPRAS
jgi:hypothetical protein